MKDSDRCFCELAPFYALSLLDESERLWVEAQIEAEPELAIEIVDFEAALSALPYSAPIVPMAVDLKQRLFYRIDQPLEATAMTASEAISLVEKPAEMPVNRPKGYVSISRSQDLEWFDYRVPGITIACFHIDPETRQTVGLLKAAAGVKYPLHRHADVEELYMLEGELIVDGTAYQAGDYIRSAPGSSHYAKTINGCMLFFRASLDNEYLQ